jgi:hypothetical protein
VSSHVVTTWKKIAKSGGLESLPPSLMCIFSVWVETQLPPES